MGLCYSGPSAEDLFLHCYKKSFFKMVSHEHNYTQKNETVFALQSAVC